MEFAVDTAMPCSTGVYHAALLQSAISSMRRGGTAAPKVAFDSPFILAAPLILGRRPRSSTMRAIEAEMMFNAHSAKPYCAVHVINESRLLQGRACIGFVASCYCCFPLLAARGATLPTAGTVKHLVAPPPPPLSSKPPPSFSTYTPSTIQFLT